jgi:hypothetical protein
MLPSTDLGAVMGVFAESVKFNSVGESLLNDRVGAYFLLFITLLLRAAKV